MLRIIDVARFDKYYPEVFEREPVQSYLKGELDRVDIKGIWTLLELKAYTKYQRFARLD